MSLNKKKMVREIGRRTRLKNRDVQAVIETLVEVWTEELVSGGRIELENFMVIDVQTVELSTIQVLQNHCYRRVTLRAGKKLRDSINFKT
jgi:nucleoid DNA-binding protein